MTLVIVIGKTYAHLNYESDVYSHEDSNSCFVMKKTKQFGQ
jgi:hypothetical protein